MNIQSKSPSKMFAIAISAFICSLSFAAAQDGNPPPKINPEAAARIQKDIEYLASDAMEGRGVQTDGLKRAGEFIANRWNELGLMLDSFDGKPFQDFGVPGPMQLGSPDKNLLEFYGPDGQRISLKLGTDFTSVTLGINGTFSGPLAFAGYGITAKDPAENLNYDDYKDWDPKGKVVIVIRKEPQQNDPKSVFAGKDPSDYSFYSTKESNAYAHGVAAMIMINDGQTVGAGKPWSADDRTELLNDLNDLSEIRKQIETAESNAEQQSNLIAKLNASTQQLKQVIERFEQSADLLPSVDGAGRAFGRRRIPTLFAKRSVIEPLITKATGKSLAQIEAEIDKDLQPQSKVIDGWEAKGEAETKEAKLPVRNVLAVLPGEGDLKEEYVVVGAHYDHVGMGGAGSLAPGTIAVHNGADDNGSGTVALLEVSRRLSESIKNTPSRRSIVFIAFSAEELGLLGSAHYVRNPRFPLEQTVAMVNMDMVGRLASNVLTVYGTGTAVEFDSMIEETNKSYQFDLDKSPEGMGPSDHASFFEKKIPVFHFFTGLHPDYHRPSDDFDKINVTGIVRITDMVTDVVTQLATSKERPKFIPIRGSANPRQQSATPPPGKMQIALLPGENVVIESLVPGGAAEKAGLKAGDRIVQIGTNAITTVESLKKVMENKVPGEKMTIEIVRDGQTSKFEIQLVR